MRCQNMQRVRHVTGLSRIRTEFEDGLDRSDGHDSFRDDFNGVCTYSSGMPIGP